MIKILVAMLFAATLTGCGMFEKRVEYRDKLVPIYTVPAPPDIERPVLPIHADRYQNPMFLADPNNIGQIVQDYTVSLRLTLNYSVAQEEIIDTYRRLSERDFANQPLLRSVSNSTEDSPPSLFSTSGVNSTEAAAFVNQVEFEVYARSAFADVVDKYEDRKEEILNDET